MSDYKTKMDVAVAIIVQHNAVNPQNQIDAAAFAANAKLPPYEWHDADDLAHVTADEIAALAGGRLPAVKVRRILSTWQGTGSAQPAGPQAVATTTAQPITVSVDMTAGRPDLLAPGKLLAEIAKPGHGGPEFINAAMRRDDMRDVCMKTDKPDEIDVDATLAFWSKGHNAVSGYYGRHRVLPLADAIGWVDEHDPLDGDLLVDGFNARTGATWKGVEEEVQIALVWAKRSTQIRLDDGARIADECRGKALSVLASGTGPTSLVAQRYTDERTRNPAIVETARAQIRRRAGHRPSGGAMRFEEAGRDGGYPFSEGRSGGDRSPAPARVARLTQNQLSEIHTAAIKAGLATSRSGLLSGVNPFWVAGLPVVDGPSAQLLVDLNRLNEAQLSDGSCPMATWLSNAVALSAGRVESAVFSRYLNPSTPAAPRLPDSLSGQDLQAFHDALLSAYNLASFKMMLMEKLNKNLDEIAAPSGFGNVVFEVLGAANAQGWLADLLVGACERNPGNPKLRAFAAKYTGQTTAPIGGAYVGGNVSQSTIVAGGDIHITHHNRR